MPLVSVIVPVYNVEKYLSRCIESIQNQTYTDFELILVDDGSTDKCGKICDEYVNSDSRIKVIHQKNAGVSAARNAGLKVAIGEYIIFVDGDDKLLPDALTKHINLISSYGMSVLGYIKVSDDGDILGIMTGSTQAKKFSSKEMLRILFPEAGKIIHIPGKYEYQGYLWNKMFRLEIIKDNQIEFDESIFYNEDRLFLVNYVCHIDCVIIKNDIVYCYRDSNGAMNQLRNVNDDNIERFLTEMLAYEKMSQFIAEKQYDEESIACIYSTLLKYKVWMKNSYYSARNHRKFLYNKVLYWADILFCQSCKLGWEDRFSDAKITEKELMRWIAQRNIVGVQTKINEFIHT